MSVSRTHPTPRGKSAAWSLALLSLSGLLAALWLGGCGGKGGDDLVLATVGEKNITKGYFEERLGKLNADELPLDTDGYAVDTSTLEGKRAFLEVIINKEVMALKAIDMGYDQEEQVSGAVLAMTEYHASTFLHKDLIESPADTVSDAELAYYYDNLGQQRNCSFIITNFHDDCLKAREAVINGALWEDVAEEYHDGSRSTRGDLKVTLQWGHLDDSFENAVFNLQEGEISQPVETIYGWWLLRVDGIKQTDKPPLEEMQDRVLNSIRAQKINLSRKKFMKESQEQHDFKLDEAALWIVYQGLPEGEVLLDPETKEPTPRESLVPLDIDLTDMDKFLYQVRLDDEMQVITIGDYKLSFDNMSVFRRPKYSELLGGLRSKIIETVDRRLILQEAKEHGYFEDPRVTSEVDGKKEEMMVSRLYSEAITFDNQVKPDQIEEFYQLHKGDYVVSEGRQGRIVFCADQAQAGAAAVAARDGKPWPEILDQYGTDESNLALGGETEVYRSTGSGPLKDALFSLASAGDVAAPFQQGDKWAVVRLYEVEPELQKTKDEVLEEVAQRIRMRRKDQALKDLLAEWRDEYSVMIYEDRLDKCRPWEELAGGDES